MIKNARVSLSAVKSFEQAVSSVTDLSLGLDRGIETIEQLIMLLTDLANRLNDKISDMDEAREDLEGKIQQIEEVLASLREQLNDLEDELEELEDELDSTDEYYTYIDSDGDEHEARNPDYDDLCEQISDVEAEISSVEGQMRPHEQRLERATAVNGKLASYIDASRGVIYSLEEKKNSCKQFVSELTDIKKGNIRKGEAARSSLKKIEALITAYLKVKMLIIHLPVLMIFIQVVGKTSIISLQ